MRLTQQQIVSIRSAAEDAFGPSTRVTLFGSRVDDNKRGGDIDLLIQPTWTDQPVVRKLRFLGVLESELGERKVDVVIELAEDSRPIVQVAHETGVAL
jgi:predicted nucleotidyltransferase